MSSGSACTSASLEPSYVLRALGVEEDMAHTSIRFGLGRFTTPEEVCHGLAVWCRIWSGAESNHLAHPARSQFEMGRHQWLAVLPKTGSPLDDLPAV